MEFATEHRLRNNLEEIQQVVAWLEDFSLRTAIPDSVRNAFDLSLEECLTNIISYAWNDGLEHWITLRFKHQERPDRVAVEVEDDGREFNPLAVPPVNINVPLETRSVGGLGIHMIRQIMTNVEYRRQNGRNILTLTKDVPYS